MSLWSVGVEPRRLGEWVGGEENGDEEVEEGSTRPEGPWDHLDFTLWQP